jgi:hypothetical protein
MNVDAIGSMHSISNIRVLKKLNYDYNTSLFYIKQDSAYTIENMERLTFGIRSRMYKKWKKSRCNRLF